MTVLQPYQFEINGYAFGRDLDVSTNDDGFDSGTDTAESQDVFNRYFDSIAFGEDAVSPAPWMWELHTDTARSAADSLNHLRDFGVAWKSAVERRVPGAVAALRYNIGGRTRVIFGRPRPLGLTTDNSIIAGHVGITAEFARSDILFYDDEVQETTITLVAPVGGGLITPLVTPLTTVSSAPNSATIPLIGGDEPAPFEATFRGPITNPVLRGGDWEVRLAYSISDNESVTVSSYPWGARAVRDDGANLSGRLGSTRLYEARLDPAGETLQLDGIDSTGTASCTIAWRRAYQTI